jgi:hypothetical protein
LSDATISNSFPTFIDWTSLDPGTAPSADDMNRLTANSRAMTIGWGLSALCAETSCPGDGAWHDVSFNLVQWNTSPDTDKWSTTLDVGGSGLVTEFTAPATGRALVIAQLRGSAVTNTGGYWSLQGIKVGDGVPFDLDRKSYTFGVQQVLKLTRTLDLAKGQTIKFQQQSSASDMVVDFDNPRPYVNLEWLHRDTA